MVITMEHVIVYNNKKIVVSVSKDYKHNLYNMYEYKHSSEIDSMSLYILQFMNALDDLNIHGIPTKITDDQYIIPAVHLHKGDRLNINLTKNSVVINGLFAGEKVVDNLLVKMDKGGLLR